MKATTLGTALISTLIGTTTALAGTKTYDFNDGTLGGLLVTNNPGYSVNVAGGVATVSNPAGTNGGRITLTTPFVVSGDFTASFLGNRTGIGESEIGIGAGSDSAAISNIFFQRSNVIASNMFKPSLFTLFQDPNTSPIVTLTISRVGNTITQTYNDGVVNIAHSVTDPSVAAAVSINLFLIEEFGDTGAHTGTIDNFTITSASVIPEPTSLALIALPSGLLLRRRRSN